MRTRPVSSRSSGTVRLLKNVLIGELLSPLIFSVCEVCIKIRRRSCHNFWFLGEREIRGMPTLAVTYFDEKKEEKLEETNLREKQIWTIWIFFYF